MESYRRLMLAQLSEREKQLTMINPEIPTKTTTPEIKYPCPEYYIDVEDKPTDVISSTILDGDREKYWIWDRMLQVGLTAKGKLGFINGEITKPNDNESPPEVLAQWKRCNAMVMSWIYNIIDPKLHPKIVQKCDTAKELHEHVRARFAFPRNFRSIELWKQVMELKDKNLSISDHIDRFEMIWNEMEFYWDLRERDAEVITHVVQKKKKSLDQTTIIYFFLASLNDQFKNATTRLLLSPLPDFQRVKEFFLEDQLLTLTKSMNSN